MVIGNTTELNTKGKNLHTRSILSCQPHALRCTATRVEHLQTWARTPRRRAHAP
jgi:hypothetical protein